MALSEVDRMFLFAFTLSQHIQGSTKIDIQSQRETEL